MAFATLMVCSLDFVFTYTVLPVKSLHLPFRAWLGVGISAFAEFEQFYSEGFPPGTPIEVRCSTD